MPPWSLSVASKSKFWKCPLGVGFCKGEYRSCPLSPWVLLPTAGGIGIGIGMLASLPAGSCRHAGPWHAWMPATHALLWGDQGVG
jgi:hypothetical protein